MQTFGMFRGGMVVSGGFSPLDGKWGLDVLMPDGTLAFEFTNSLIVHLLRDIGMPAFPPADAIHSHEAMPG